MARPADLAEARTALRTAHGNYDAATENLYAALVAKDYGAAQTLWKQSHEAVLGLKGALNNLYRHLGELKPTKADKLKPGGKLDNASAGTKRDQKADARRAEEAAETKPTPKAGKKGDRTTALERKADRKNKRRAETEDTAPIMAGTASDEPTDVGDDPDAP